jgi:hypothetical protein
MRLPWSDLKVAFDIANPDRFIAALDSGKAELPAGWEWNEADGAGARWVAVFRVNVLPTVGDGRTVCALIRRWGR